MNDIKINTFQNFMVNEHEDCKILRDKIVSFYGFNGL
jgi:hypothetical protein